MIKLKEKVSWLIELETNRSFNCGRFHTDIILEYQDWFLMLNENGGILLTKNLIQKWRTVQPEPLIIQFLCQLPDTKKEFYSLVQGIINNGSLKSPYESQYYSSYIEGGFEDNFINILQCLDFRSMFNERERLRFAIKKVYDDRFRFNTVSLFLLCSLFFVIWIVFYIVVMNAFFPESLDYLEMLEIGMLIYFVFFIDYLFSFKKRKKQVSILFNALDNLGIECLKFNDRFESEFLSRNILENSNSIIHDIMKEKNEMQQFNFVN